MSSFNWPGNNQANRSYITDSTGWTGSVNSVSYAISGWANDVRQGEWVLRDAANNYEAIQGALISHTSSTNVTVSFDNNLPAGTYVLVGVG